MNSYELTRNFWDWAFENPEKIKPIHSAIYFFCIEHCNRLGWKEKFGFPSQMTMDAIGVKNYKTYINGFNELVDFGFIKLIEKSKNQYSANIIGLVKNTKANTKALSKATLKHDTKHSQSIVSIDKHINLKPIKQIYKEFDHLKISIEEFDKLIESGYSKNQIDNVLLSIENYSKNKNYKSLYLTSIKWLAKEQPANKIPEFKFVP